MHTQNNKNAQSRYERKKKKPSNENGKISNFVESPYIQQLINSGENGFRKALNTLINHYYKDIDLPNHNQSYLFNEIIHSLISKSHKTSFKTHYQRESYLQSIDLFEDELKNISMEDDEYLQNLFSLLVKGKYHHYPPLTHLISFSENGELSIHLNEKCRKILNKNQ